MSPGGFGQRLVLEPRRSQYLLAFLLLSHVLALLALLLPMELAAGWRSVLGLLIVASLLYQLRRSGWLGPEHPVRLILTADDSWIYQDQFGEWDDLQLLPNSLRWQWLIILRLHKPRAPGFTVVLFPDSLDPASWHLLELRLRFAG